jgi:hypothetical protein
MATLLGKFADSAVDVPVGDGMPHPDLAIRAPMIATE